MNVHQRPLPMGAETPALLTMKEIGPLLLVGGVCQIRPSNKSLPGDPLGPGMEYNAPNMSSPSEL